MLLDERTVMKVLEEKGAVTPCSACNELNWNYFHATHLLLHLYDDGVRDEVSMKIAHGVGGGTWLQGTGTGTIALICNNCGFVRLHSKVALGLD